MEWCRVSDGSEVVGTKDRRSIMSSSSSSSLQSPGLVGAWFCQISSGLRRGGRAELDEQSAKNTAGRKALNEEATTGTAGAKTSTSAVTSSSCRGRAGAAMPEATVCLLLDRFAPS
ncbi:hypothetical protein E2562_038022 [Oryza meyeriana var. granulata]|uniref:Uncharacterized protein n=1 Tax=Oryza meyeriana var. granulata TaxID=110450 RepID=A0A6G1EDS2_9ORYZ|nr:hypothetical protein E2562_038022 [Oryza meyeriana var. granulata]